MRSLTSPFFLALALLLQSLCVFAESPQITLNALRSMEQARRERAGICARIRANPNCPNREALLKQATGVTTLACQATVRAHRCESFFERFPQYRSSAMTCEPNEVCKLALESTLAEGCRRYGIEVKDGFLSMLSSAGQCLTQWQCVARTSFTGAMAILMPGQFAAQKGQQMAEATVQSFRDDRAKLEKAACLDPETQAQLYCYLGVKYGGMALGVAGAARAAGAGLMARMATLEKDLVATEVRTAARASAPAVSTMNAELQALKDFIKADRVRSLNYHLEIVNGKGVLTINYMGLEDSRVLALMTRAVRAGAISKIDAGQVVGPKVLNVLTRLRDVVPANAPLKIEGTLAPAALDKNVFRDIVESRAGRARDVAGRWSDQDVANYQQARRILRIDEACDRLFVGKCEVMKFSMDARRPEAVTWMRAR